MGMGKHLGYCSVCSVPKILEGPTTFFFLFKYPRYMCGWITAVTMGVSSLPQDQVCPTCLSLPPLLFPMPFSHNKMQKMALMKCQLFDTGIFSPQNYKPVLFLFIVNYPVSIIKHKADWDIYTPVHTWIDAYTCLYMLSQLRRVTLAEHVGDYISISNTIYQ